MACIVIYIIIIKVTFFIHIEVWYALAYFTATIDTTGQGLA